MADPESEKALAATTEAEPVQPAPVAEPEPVKEKTILEPEAPLPPPPPRANNGESNGHHAEEQQNAEKEPETEGEKGGKNAEERLEQSEESVKNGAEEPEKKSEPGEMDAFDAMLTGKAPSKEEEEEKAKAKAISDSDDDGAIGVDPNDTTWDNDPGVAPAKDDDSKTKQEEKVQDIISDKIVVQDDGRKSPEPEAETEKDKTEDEPKGTEMETDAVKEKKDDENGENKEQNDGESKEVVTVADSGSPIPPPAPDFEQISDSEWFASLPKEELEWYEELGPRSERSQSVQCTVCHKQITNLTTFNVVRHPVLGVVLCRQCRLFYNDGNWSKDEEGCDEYCRWCAQGGDLLLCDKCSNAFCKRCVQRNLGRKFLTNIQTADEWRCLVCEPKQLYKFRAQYHALSKILIKHVPRSESAAPKEPKEPKKPPPTKNFIDETISNAFETLGVYHQALEDERRRWARKRSAMEPEFAAEVSKIIRRIFMVTKRNVDLLDAFLVEGFKDKFPDYNEGGHQEALKVEENDEADKNLTPKPLGGNAKAPAKKPKLPAPAPAASPAKKRASSSSSPKKAASGQKKKKTPLKKAAPAKRSGSGKSTKAQPKVSANLFGKRSSRTSPAAKSRSAPKSRKRKAESSSEEDSDSDVVELIAEKKAEVTKPSLFKKPKMGPKSRVKR